MYFSYSVDVNVEVMGGLLVGFECVLDPVDGDLVNFTSDTINGVYKGALPWVERRMSAADVESVAEAAYSAWLEDGNRAPSASALYA